MKIIKLSKFFLKYQQIIILFLLAIVVFLSFSSFNYLTQKKNFIKWASPDENANYIFAKLYGQTGYLSIFEKYNLYAHDIIHPRSFRSDKGWLKPMSFLGLPIIYGEIVFFTNYHVLPYLTPFFAAIGLVYFYFLVKKIFGRHNAFLSVFILAIFPPFVYYSARSMFHNVLFVVFLIVGIYYGVLMTGKIKSKLWLKKGKWLGYIYASLSGLFLGLAIITRESELLWLAPLLLFIWLFNIKKISLLRLVFFLVFLFLAITPVLHYNKILYGSYFYGGYAEMNKSIATVASASSDLIKNATKGNISFIHQPILKIKKAIFYFGLHPRQSFSMAYIYIFKMFPWLAWPALFGLILFFSRKKKIKRKYFIYLIAYLLMSCVLIIYYGSWIFHDNPDPNSYTIGNSYTRYWLPVYLGAIPFVSFFIMVLTRGLCDLFFNKENKTNYKSIFLSFKLSKRFCLASSRALIIVFLSYFAIQFVLFGSNEGLYFLGKRQIANHFELQQVLNLTEKNSVIITRYHDKLFFPERKVIVGLFNDKNMVSQYANLIQYLPVYYYNFTFPPQDLKYLNSRRLKEVGLNIKKIKQITPNFTLYKLISLPLAIAKNEGER